jgi:hypothetical protein
LNLSGVIFLFGEENIMLKTRLPAIIHIIAMLSASLLFYGCGDSGGKGSSARYNVLWTWVSGDSTVNQSGVYGTQGVAAATNKPGSRYGSTSCTDSSGNLWLFGGYGLDSVGNENILNDLWKFDGTNWIWVSGDNTVNQNGVYGTQGAAVATNKPGAREFSISWTDSRGNLWFFGGDEYDKEGALRGLHYLCNDLWMVSP